MTAADGSSPPPPETPVARVPAVPDPVYDRRSQYGLPVPPYWDGAGEQSLRDLSHRVARRWWLLLGVAVTVFAGVAAYTFLATPRYQSVARLRIESANATPSMTSALADQASSAMPGGGAAGGLLGGLGRDELETDIGVLRSDRMSDAVVDSLDLMVRVTAPPDGRSRFVSARTVDPSSDSTEGRLTLTRQAGGRYLVERKKLEDAGPIRSVMTPGSPVRVGGSEITLSPSLAVAGPERIVIDVMPRYKVHKLLDRRLTIERQEGGSRLVEITFQDPDRTLAAQVVRRLVAAYLDYTRSTDETENTFTSSRLQLQVDSARRQLTAAEEALRSFETRSGMIVPEDQASAQVKRIAAVSTRIDAINTERNALSRMLAIIDRKSRGGADASAYRELATFPSLITNRAIQDLLQSLVDLENKQSDLGTRRTEANPDYHQLTLRISAIEHQLYELGPQYLESLGQQLATEVQTASALTDTLDNMPGAATQYVRLMRDRTVAEGKYIALEKQLTQADVRNVLREDRVHVIDAPRVANPDDPSSPKKSVMLLLGAVLGVALALTVGLIVELWVGGGAPPPVPVHR